MRCLQRMFSDWYGIDGASEFGMQQYPQRQHRLYARCVTTTGSDSTAGQTYLVGFIACSRALRIRYAATEKPGIDCKCQSSDKSLSVTLTPGRLLHANHGRLSCTQNASSRANTCGHRKLQHSRQHNRRPRRVDSCAQVRLPSAP